MLAGELPTRDFWTLYAPGHYYVLAGLLAAFGRTWQVAVWAGAATCAAALGLAFLAWRRLGSRPLGAALAVLAPACSLLATPFHHSFGTYPPVLLCLMAAWWAVAPSLRGERDPRGLLAAGLALGAGALFKHDVTAWAALAMALGLVAAGLSARAPAGRIARDLARLALPAAALFAPLLWLAIGGDLRDAWHDGIVFPATDFPFARPQQLPPWLPFPFLWPDAQTPRVGDWVLLASDWVRVVGPAWLALAGALPALAARATRPAALALASAFALHQIAAGVQLNTHLVSLALYAAALAALGASAAGPRVRRALGVALAAFCLAAAAGPALGAFFSRGRPSQALALPTARGMRLAPVDANELAALAGEVAARVPPGEPIFVGERRHDAIIANASSLYFLLDRPPASRYHELHPAVADTAAVQDEIIASLAAERPRLILLRDLFGDAQLDRFRDELRRHVPAVGSLRLDRWIAAHYREVARVGHIALLAPRPDAADADAGGLPPQSRVR